MASWSLRPGAPAYARITLWALGLFRRPGSATYGAFSSDDVFRMNPVERVLKQRGHSRGWCGPIESDEGPLRPSWTSGD